MDEEVGGEGDEHVYEVYSDEAIFDENFSVFWGGYWKVRFVLED